jgi:hypothetical protein
MNRFALVLALALLVSACGGSASLDPAMAGTWAGTATVTMSGLNPLQYSSGLRVSVSGDTAMVSGICPNGGGAINTVGSGSSAGWTGSYACPPIAFSDCPAVTFTFTSGHIDFRNGALVAQGAATGAGCGLTRAASFSFTGSKN